MSLDYEFSPIDVNITTHPKAFAAGVEAMGLWLWGMAHARQQRTNGRLHRAAVLGAWGGKRNVMLAKRLVDSGLWVVRDDGDWDVWNFEKKGAGRTTSSAERMRRHRAKKPGIGDSEEPSVTSHVTAGDANGDVTVVTSCSTSPSHSSGLDPDLASSPPPWFVVALDVIEMTAGEKLHPGEAWLRYRGHRSKKGEPMSQHDAEYWLTTVIVREIKDAREEAHRRDARDGERTKAIVRERHGPEVKPLPSVAPLIRERERWEREAASTEDSAKAAENLRKLLGKVGS